MLNNKRSYGDKSGIGFNKNKDKKMKKQDKISYLISCALNAMRWLTLQNLAQPRSQR
jgi:hypothetical protein